jgi:hypothetical protein
VEEKRAITSGAPLAQIIQEKASASGDPGRSNVQAFSFRAAQEKKA